MEKIRRGNRDLSKIPTELEHCFDVSGRFEAAWFAAHEAAAFLMNDRPADLLYTSKSTSTDLVSQMDKAAEDMIVHHIIQDFPQDGVLGEEGEDRNGSSNARWIIDPLDGTVNYLFGVPLWGVSIAIEIDHVVEYGIVVTPVQDETYIARRGGGAWKIRGIQSSVISVEQVQVRATESLETALVMTGFAYSPQKRGRQAELIKDLIPYIADIRRNGAAVIDLCWFASGRSDAYFESGLNLWDYAAGALIAQEAGAIVQGLENSSLSEYLVAATPQIFEQLHSLLMAKGARDIIVFSD
jgi:myo-inositol-1(or 4)-monophosphatase